MHFTNIVSRVSILFALTLSASGHAQAASSLGAYNVNPNTVTVAVSTSSTLAAKPLITSRANSSVTSAVAA